MEVLYFGKAVGASGGTLMFSDDPQSFPQSQAPQQKLEITWYHPYHYDLVQNQVCQKRENEGAGKVDDMANWGKVATMKALPSLPQNWANSKLASLSTMFGSNWSHSQLWFHSPSSHLHMQPLPLQSPAPNTASWETPTTCALVSAWLLLGGNVLVVPRCIHLVESIDPSPPSPHGGDPSLPSRELAALPGNLSSDQHTDRFGGGGIQYCLQNLEQL